MPSVTRLPQTEALLVLLVVTCENQESAIAFAVVDNTLPMGGQSALDPNKFSNYNKPESMATAAHVTNVAPCTVFPVNEISAPFGECST